MEYMHLELAAKGKLISFWSGVAVAALEIIKHHSRSKTELEKENYCTSRWKNCGIVCTGWAEVDFY